MDISKKPNIERLAIPLFICLICGEEKLEYTEHRGQRLEQLLHCKDKIPNFETNIPGKGISGSQSQFPHSCVCARFIYSKIGLPILLEEICTWCIQNRSEKCE